MTVRWTFSRATTANTKPIAESASERKPNSPTGPSSASSPANPSLPETKQGVLSVITAGTPFLFSGQRRAGTSPRSDLTSLACQIHQLAEEIIGDENAFPEVSAPLLETTLARDARAILRGNDSGQRAHFGKE